MIENVAIMANPSFACAGVNWGLEQFDRILEEEHEPVYVANRNGLVHYPPLMERQIEKGARFVDSPRDIPEHSVVSSPMHGLSPMDVAIYLELGVKLYDLRCYLVTQVAERALRAIEIAREAGKIAKILYACKDLNHPEPKAILELAPNHIVPVTNRSVLEEYEVRDDEMYFVDSQTTTNVQVAEAQAEEFRHKFPGLRNLKGRIVLTGACFATSNRQASLDGILNAEIDKLVVVTSSASANGSQLKDIGHAHMLPVEVVEKATELDPNMFVGYSRVGVTGAASVPPFEGHLVMAQFKDWGYQQQHLFAGRKEPVTFSLKPPVYDFRSGNVPQEVIESLVRTY